MKEEVEEVSGMASHSTDTSAQLDDQHTADQGTVKFLNFRMPEKLAVITLKFQQRDLSIEKFVQKVQME